MTKVNIYDDEGHYIILLLWPFLPINRNHILIGKNMEELTELHHQSLEWLNDVDFWCDETAVMAVYVSDFSRASVLQPAKTLTSSINREILNLTGGELDDFKKEVREHEIKLASLFEKESQASESEYRNIHNKLAWKFKQFESRLRQLKKQVRELTAVHNHKNVVLATIYNRRAVRKYKNKPVSGELIQQIIQAGRMAPSAMNSQPWKFYVVTENTLIKKLSDEIFGFAETVFPALHDSDHHLSNDPIFHEAPVIIFLTAPKENEWAVLDVGMCAQNMMLASNALGLETCPIGLARFIEKTSGYSMLGVPKTERIVVTLTLGYGDEQPGIPERKKIMLYISEA